MVELMLTTKEQPTRPRGRPRKDVPDTLVGGIAGRIRAARLAKSLTVQQVAKRCGLSEWQYYRIEQGGSIEATMRHLEKIAKILRVKASDLLTGK